MAKGLNLHEIKSELMKENEKSDFYGVFPLLKKSHKVPS